MKLRALLASLALLAGLLVSAMPAQAAQGAGCWQFDTPGVVYQDWHGQTSVTVSDSWPGGNPTHSINTDLYSYRYTIDGGDGFNHCYRTYYASGWTGDGSGGYFQAEVGFKVCGSSRVQYNSSTVWGARQFVVFDGSVGSPAPTGVNSVTVSVTFPDAVNRSVWFLDYGVTPCLPDGDQSFSNASSSTWSSQPSSSSGYTAQSPWLWRCRFSNGVVCGS